MGLGISHTHAQISKLLGACRAKTESSRVFPTHPIPIMVSSISSSPEGCNGTVLSSVKGWGIEEPLCHYSPPSLSERAMVGGAKGGGAAVGGGWAMPQPRLPNLRESFGGKQCWAVLSLKY